MRKKEQEVVASQGFGPAEVAPSTASRMIAPLDIQQKEFSVSRFGGYKMRDVDEFLDQITDAMTAVIAENERLRQGGGAAPVVGNSDLTDVNRQADEMIQRARDEASRIVAEARQQAAALSGTGVAATDVERAAVAAFLAREKEFLQSLAGLVQGHAEQVKTMARSSRGQSGQAGPPAPATSATKPTTAAEPAPPAPEPAASAGATKQAESTSESEVTQAPTPAPGEDGATVQLPKAEEPVRVDQPEPARAGRPEHDDPAASDSSLRELFWGED